MQTAITQPAVLTMDTAICRLLGEYGFEPDMVMGHSLGEYAALVAAGVMPFAEALEAAAARGREMTQGQRRRQRLDGGGDGAAATSCEQTLAEIDGYVVPANINSRSQVVIGGASKAVEQAIERLQAEGLSRRSASR